MVVYVCKCICTLWMYFQTIIKHFNILVFNWIGENFALSIRLSREKVCSSELEDYSETVND